MSDMFLMPAEWAPQKRTWLAWPHNEADWPGKFAPVPWVFAEIVRLIADHQRVGLFVKNAAAKSAAKKILARAHANLRHVDFVVANFDRGWMRDCGAIYVQRGAEMLGLDWGFTGWAKYANHKADTLLP
ncbi:MAG: agmatine deiminase family protein, partial [Rickettsiales bacterium]